MREYSPSLLKLEQSQVEFPERDFSNSLPHPVYLELGRHSPKSCKPEQIWVEYPEIACRH